MKSKILIIIFVLITIVMGLSVGMAVVVEHKNVEIIVQEGWVRTYKTIAEYQTRRADFYEGELDLLKQMINESPISPLDAAGVLRFAEYSHRSIIDNPERWQVVADAGYTASIMDHVDWEEFYQQSQRLMLILARYE